MILNKGREMKIYNETSDPNIREAIKRFLAIIETERFYQELSDVDYFGLNKFMPDHLANVLAKEISQDLKHSFSLDFNFTIKEIRPANPWSKMIATTFENDPNSLYINSRKTFSTNSRVNTICHECIHLFYYKHAGNSATAFNLTTVPYLAGEVAERLANEIYGR